jgi:hypothetical protein
LFKIGEIGRSGFRNWNLWFVGTDSNQGRRRASTGCSSSAQSMFGQWRDVNHNSLRGWGRLRDLIDKNENGEKTRTKVEEK